MNATSPPPMVPDAMTAAVYRGPGRLELIRCPVPEPGPTDVLIEVSHCGVCGTDLHEVLEGWGLPDTIGGHEYAGVVVKVGRAVDRWQLGDRVVPGVAGGCGACDPCLMGRPALCLDHPTPGTTRTQGAFANYMRVDQTHLWAAPVGVSLREAALVEPLAVALHGVHRSGARPGQRVLVSGAGPIGALTIAGLVAMDIGDIGVVEPGAVRAELARQLGARTLKAPDQLEVPTIAEPGRIVDDAYDIVIETSGRRSAIEAGLGQLKRAGTLVIVGSGIDPPRFDPNRILLNELVITGSFGSDARGFEHASELLTSGRLPLDLLLHPDDVPLTSLLDTMQGLARGEIAGKALVDPRLQGVPS